MKIKSNLHLKRIAGRNLGIALFVYSAGFVTDLGAQTTLSGDHVITGNLEVGSSGNIRNLMITGTATAARLVITATGTAGLPNFSFFGDFDTGLFHPDENMLGISTGGVERIRIDGFGNIGVGIENPAVKLDVNGAAIIRGHLNVQAGGKINLFATSGTTASIIIDPESSQISINGQSLLTESGASGIFMPAVPAFLEVGTGVASGSNSAAVGRDVEASGNYSVAMGLGSLAMGDYSVALGAGSVAGDFSSTAMGNGTYAGGGHATAMGSVTSALGGSSTAFGLGALAGGYASTALGFFTEAIGDNSTAMGDGTHAVGGGSIAIGYGTWAVGVYSTASGQGTWASGEVSTAMGRWTSAGGTASTALGTFTSAPAYASVAIGRGNIGGFDSANGGDENWIPTDPLFEVGNGTGDVNDPLEIQKRNAFTIFKDGKIQMQRQGDILMGEFGNPE